MPFSTDGNWPQFLIDIFNFYHNSRDEHCFSGPYNKLLNYTLLQGSTFYSSLQFSPDDDRDTFFVIYDLGRKPLLIVDIKDDTWAHRPRSRWRADTQMRQRCLQELEKCPMPYLYGLSFMGTSLRVYRADKATGDITPDLVDPKGKRVPRDFLKGQWNLDLLSQEGFMQMKEVVSYIKAEVASVVE